MGIYTMEIIEILSNWNGVQSLWRTASVGGHHICESNRNKPHYLQAQTNGNGCSCRVSFGGDKWRSSLCPRKACAFHWGIYEKALMAQFTEWFGEMHLGSGGVANKCMLEKLEQVHDEFYPGQPWPFWIEKSAFHSFFNKNNGIFCHSYHSWLEIWRFPKIVIPPNHWSHGWPWICIESHGGFGISPLKPCRTMIGIE